MGSDIEGRWIGSRYYGQRIRPNVGGVTQPLRSVVGPKGLRGLRGVDGDFVILPTASQKHAKLLNFL